MAKHRQSTLPAGDRVDDRFLADVVDGLTAEPKTLPCKYFYDQRGSQLFERICELDEYYLTRTEMAIMQRHAAAMADRLGRRCLLIEPGSGSSLKTRLLLDHLIDPAGYVPVDISGAHLHDAAAKLARQFPALRIMPVHADFSTGFNIPEPPEPPARCVVYFPGSTIGNYSRPEAVDLLARKAALAGPGAGLLIGIDLVKDARIIEAAYNDPQGVTAAFNRNLLGRINRELGADFQVGHFAHRAFFNHEHSRIEMHLVSTRPQTVAIDQTTITFTRGESIHTENSYKYTLDGFAALAAEAGWQRQAQWIDDDQRFAVHYGELIGPH